MPEQRSRDQQLEAADDDRFAPPEARTVKDLDLVHAPPVARGPAPTMASALDQPQPHPAGRKPVAYKNQGGLGNLLLWLAGATVLAGGLGFGAVFARRMFSTPGAPAAVAPQAPAKPVTWTAVKTGDAVLVTVEVTPRTARLLIDGEPAQSNPLRVPKGGRHTVTALADGFEPATIDFVADAARTVRLQLRRSRR